MSTTAENHYLSNEVDPLFIAGARDYLYRYLKRGRILNLGLGYGTWDAALAKETSSLVIGLDISGVLIEQFSKLYPSIHYVLSDVFDYEPEAPFDTIVASHFLEHMAEPVQLLEKLRAWLAPGGCLLLVVPNAQSAHRLIGKQMGMLGEVTDLNDADRMLGHYRVYTAEILRKHVAQGGLSISHLSGVTLKALSNGQLAQLPRAYVDACCALHDLDMACQLAAVVVHG